MKKLAVIGDPIAHSMSPKMHNFLSNKYNNDYFYEAVRVKKDELGEWIKNVKELGVAGFNVTIPHKFDIIPYLDEISPDAKIFGAVNTVVNNQGRLIGYNTDAEGFYLSLKNEGVSINGKDILIIGAGGATQALVLMLIKKGVKSITVKNRTFENAKKLYDYAKKVSGFEILLEPSFKKYDIVINTTPVGMYPHTDASPISDYSFIDGNTVAVDLIYNPYETLFLKNAKSKGAKTINGLGMLIYQGILAYELFTDTKLPKDAFNLIEKEVFSL